MYHDQALIPAKALAFDEAVNVTLGLPFVRTSPDHGTAFDIAGKGTARADSLIAALKLAARLAATELAAGMSSTACRRCATSSSATGLRPRSRSARISCSTSTSPARSRAPPAICRRRHGHRGRARPGRPDPRAAGARRRAGSSPSSATSAAWRRWPRSATHYPGRLEVIAGDALKTDFAALAGGRPVKIVANLPYNIGTELLVRWLTVADWPPFYQSLTLMFQREVARAHRRARRQRRLRPARRARRLAHRGADRLRRAAAGLHAAAEGDLLGRAI